MAPVLTLTHSRLPSKQGILRVRSGRCRNGPVRSRHHDGEHVAQAHDGDRVVVGVHHVDAMDSVGRKLDDHVAQTAVRRARDGRRMLLCEQQPSASEHSIVRSLARSTATLGALVGWLVGWTDVRRSHDRGCSPQTRSRSDTIDTCSRGSTQSLECREHYAPTTMPSVQATRVVREVRSEHERHRSERT